MYLIQPNAERSLARRKRCEGDATGHFFDAVDIVSHFLSIVHERRMVPTAGRVRKFFGIQCLVCLARLDECVQEPEVRGRHACFDQYSIVRLALLEMNKALLSWTIRIWPKNDFDRKLLPTRDWKNIES